MHISVRKLYLFIILIAPFFSTLSANTLFDNRFEAWEAKAKQGDRYAQYKLGRSYLLGSQVKVNVPLAIEWLEKAAVQGYSKAAYRLGSIYYSNLDGSKNYKKALKWFSRAAKDNHAEAQYYIAMMYYEGRGVTRNYETALRWAQKSKRNGESLADRLIAKLRSNQKPTATGDKKVAVKSIPNPPTTIRFKTRDVILSGQWKSNDTLAKEIPSSLQNCIKSNKVIKCASKRLKKISQNYTADYRVESVLTNFKKNGSFEINYHYDYLFVLPEDADDPNPKYYLPEVGKTKVKTLKCHVLAKKKMKCYTRELHAVKYSRE